MLVDDHMMVRRGLAAFLKVFDDLLLVGEADSGEVAVINAAPRPQLDMILMDMALPMMDGVATTRAIRQQFPQAQVIALTSFMEGELIKKALEAEPLAICSRDVFADELARAIRAEPAGRATLSSRRPRLWSRQANQPPTPGPRT